MKCNISINYTILDIRIGITQLRYVNVFYEDKIPCQDPTFFTKEEIDRVVMSIIGSIPNGRDFCILNLIRLAE